MKGVNDGVWDMSNEIQRMKLVWELAGVSDGQTTRQTGTQGFGGKEGRLGW